MVIDVRPVKRAIERGHTDLDLHGTEQRLPPVLQPVAIVHPETGRRVLHRVTIK